MFMFRLIVYFYDLRYEKTTAGAARTVAYFLMVPNAVFPLFPVVDFKTFRRSYYDIDAYLLYQRVIDWIVRGAGQRGLHTLPFVERAPHERSPYSGLSAFAIDPIHVGVDQIEDFVAAGGRRALAGPEQEAIDRLRASPAIDYGCVRAVKERALARAFDAFERNERAGGSARARRFEAVRQSEGAWLEDYALYRALVATRPGTRWLDWEEGLRRHDPAACGAARAALARHVDYAAYVQWIAHGQLAEARRVAAAAGVEIVGDLPFTVAVDSADVWARQGDFDVAVSIGAPPDAFNAEGQDWALPAFRWDVVRANDFAWLRARLAHVARWLDGARLDHIVGYFRTYVRPRDAAPYFSPPDPDSQRALGATVLDVALSAAQPSRLLAEDLGDVPDYVREEMAARELPGYRVLRWEADGPVYRDPRAFPASSIATTGTHDTSSLAVWWCDELDDDARRRFTDVPVFAPLRTEGAAFTPAAHAGLVDGLYAAGSDIALLLVQDVFGGRERINTPATIGDGNWTYRLPLTLEHLAGAAGRERAAWLLELARRQRRAA
jgi:4-alpha-glucanotransferase